MDFSPLSNDQLLALIRAACQEAARRGTATATAAAGIVADEEQRAQSVRANAAKTHDLSDMWALKRQLARMVELTIGSSTRYAITVWRKGADRRVYLQQHFAGQYQDDESKTVYYITGNDNHPPRSILYGKYVRDRKPEILRIVEHAAAQFDELPKLVCTTANMQHVDVLPLPREWQDAYDDRIRKTYQNA